MRLDITVPGLPQQQGSKDQFGNEANKKLKPWRAEVKSAAAAVYGDTPLIRGPVRLTVRFAYPRPKSHFRTGRNAHLLRDDAPFLKSSAPDLDKLLRAVGDCLTGVVIHDDAMIAVVAAAKVYDERASTRIIVAPVEQVPPLQVAVGGVGATQPLDDVADDVWSSPPDVQTDPVAHPVGVAADAVQDVGVAVQGTVAAGRPRPTQQ